jgi:hypothetical protein
MKSPNVYDPSLQLCLDRLYLPPMQRSLCGGAAAIGLLMRQSNPFTGVVTARFAIILARDSPLARFLAAPLTRLATGL